MSLDPYAPRPSLHGGALLALLACCLGACHDWGAYDPRLGTGATGGSAGTSNSSTGASGGSGGASGSSSSSSGASGSSSSSSGGDAGTGGTLSAGGSGGSGGTMQGPIGCGPNGAPAVNETFNDGVIGPGWEAYDKLGAAIVESGGELAVTIPGGSMAGAYAFLTTAESHDLSSCEVFVKVTAVPQGANAYLHLWVDNGSGDKLEIIEWNGKLDMRETVADALTVVKSQQYVAAKQAYWKIRAAGGTVYWETSSDGKAWVTEVSKPSLASLSHVYFGVGAGDVAAEAVTRSIHFDNMNVVP